MALGSLRRVAAALGPVADRCGLVRREQEESPLGEEEAEETRRQEEKWRRRGRYFCVEPMGG